MDGAEVKEDEETETKNESGKRQKWRRRKLNGRQERGEKIQQYAEKNTKNPLYIRVIKSKKILWTGRVAHMENKRKCLQVLKTIGQLEDLDLDGRKILMCVLKKWGVRGLSLSG
jgi:hypothetical protein